MTKVVAAGRVYTGAGGGTGAQCARPWAMRKRVLDGVWIMQTLSVQ